MEDFSISRRELVEWLARAAALSPVLANAQHHASEAPAQPELLRNYQPRFFVTDDFQALKDLTAILIPSDDDPGALEAHCAEFIDFVLYSAGDLPETQENWRSAMEAIKKTGFYAAEANKRLQLVAEMARPEVDRQAQHPAYFAYRLVKRQTTFAFYTSRIGMIDVLDYKGNSYNVTFPGCNHPEHRIVS